jgi:demethylspheroidene O-methyltransferase
VAAQEQVSPPLAAVSGRGPGLRDRLLALRDRLLMDPRFQRAAARFPLTRPVANRRAAALFDVAAGFIYSQILKACLELDLFEALADGPLPVADLAERTGLAREPLERLLLAAQSLGLLQRRSSGDWGLGAHGAALLGNPGIAAMVRHHAMLYADLADPVGLLRDRSATELSRYWAYATSAEPTALAAADVARYSRLMAESQALVATDILDSFPMRGYRHLLDLAGGEGVFATQVARRWPALRVELLDLPAVAELANARFADSGLGERAIAHGGDLFDLSGYRGYDLVSLVRVLHDHDDDRVQRMLRGAREALAPGGTLLIAEPMAGTPGAEQIGDAYFGLYLWAMGSGRARRAGELEAMLHAAGFGRCREVRTPRPLLVRILVARA